MNVCDDNYRLLCARSILENLDALIAQIPGVRRGDQPDRVHDMRVATRRLRASLKLCRACLGKDGRRWRNGSAT